MLDLVVVDGRARGIVVRNLTTGEIERYAADAVVLATGGYGTVYYLSTNAVNSNVTATWRAYKRGALFANPCYTQIHPTCIPVSGEHQSKLTLMSESLRNDGRVWVPKKKATSVRRNRFPRTSATTTSSESIRASATSCRAMSRRATPSRCPTTDAASASRGLGGVPRFRRRDQTSGRRRHPREIRQPVRDVPEDHRRGCLQGADAHLPGHPLHDGRALGRLQPDEQPSRSVRPRRGQLLRPRREPPRRQRPDAGPGRRLLRHSVHDRALSGQHRRCRKSRPIIRRSPRRRRQCSSASTSSSA